MFVVVVALERSMYNVTEGDPFVEVCVVVEEGELDLDLSVGIATTNITAATQGSCTMICIGDNCYASNNCVKSLECTEARYCYFENTM